MHELYSPQSRAGCTADTRVGLRVLPERGRGARARAARWPPWPSWQRNAAEECRRQAEREAEHADNLRAEHGAPLGPGAGPARGSWVSPSPLFPCLPAPTPPTSHFAVRSDKDRE